ncbi:nucleotide sugar dehydrogenase [Pseudonocardia endophytica]|uniref:Nucleotide sugar dehydrogenase n=1 Tax=Pseudonocardia endophytica TaxID=401976 RepID=A0A4R1HKT6_PSEEN|nr:nucleotide sugar dehydrogenase [Pseudonocardia endophytica]TCK20900.1 nucleotide sugar dehydrogenase [Pseudonocardia endophytica]
MTLTPAAARPARPVETRPALTLVPRPDALPPATVSPAATVAIVGLGYVGLPTALALADAGVHVIGHDVSDLRLGAIRAGEVDLLPADHARLARHAGSELLDLTADPADLGRADAVLVCVPTPVDGHLVPDLSALAAACASVAAHAAAGQTIVLTSTTYVGSTRDLLVAPLAARGLVVGRDVFVAFSPERIDPGVADHLPERTPRVVGGVTPECSRRAAGMLAPTAAAVHVVSSPEAAEMTKLLENTFRAVNIALANEFADVARGFDVDVREVVDAAATKPYGFMAFRPGPGVGGHCIPCDPHYLLWQLRGGAVAAPLTEAAMNSIAARPHAVVERARQVLAENGRPLAGARVLLAGVAYKPGVADVRESPALTILDDLRRAGATVAFTDTMVNRVWTSAGPLDTEPDPAGTPWDLVVTHTLHPGVDHSWLTTPAPGRPLPQVLDAAYALADAPNRHVL